MDDISVLRRASPFQDSARPELEALLDAFGRRSYRAGEALWYVGDPAEHLWFVLRGQVRNVITSPEGAEIVTQVVGPGESFGQPALFAPDTPRLGTCTAVVASDVMRLGREDLLRYLETHPPALRRMLESMSRLILDAGRLYHGTVFHDVRGRLAYQLLRFAEEYGEPAAGGTRIRLKLSQDTLAGLLAMSRESVNRALSAFITAGDVRREGGYLVVARPDGLRAALFRQPRGRAGEQLI